MSTRPTVTKAVIPAAGLGTRFLPATKSQPKEMLPIVDKPSIQYVVEEAAQAGLTDVLVITAQGKEAIEEHFKPDPELEKRLEEKDKLDLLEQVRAVDALAEMHYALQGDPLGLGHAVGVARDHVGDEGVFTRMLGVVWTWQLDGRRLSGDVDDPRPVDPDVINEIEVFASHIC